MLQDLRFALRILRKNPGFTSAAVLALGLGIGANTTVFSVVNALLLRPLPFPEPARIVDVAETSRQGDATQVTPANFRAWREHTGVFEHIAAYAIEGFNLAGEPESVMGAWISTSLFRVLGVEAALGRTFVPGEESAPVVVAAAACYVPALRASLADPMAALRQQ